jgi:hypothetical protein
MLIIFDFIGGCTRTRTLDPLIKSPSRAVVLKELFSQRVAKRRVKGQYLAVDFPNGIAPPQVQRRIQIDNLVRRLKAASAGTIYQEKGSGARLLRKTLETLRVFGRRYERNTTASSTLRRSASRLFSCWIDRGTSASFRQTGLPVSSKKSAISSKSGSLPNSKLASHVRLKYG